MTFDPSDRRCWYFGPISRQDATDLLMSEGDGGVFLVRDSSSIPGDYVLCVKEDCKVCHYIINKVTEDGTNKYRIGDRCFPDLPALLSFYKLHYLDTTPLVRPATRKLEKVVAKHDFDGNDPEDLPFKRGEVLTVIRKDEEQWWTARNALGRVGAIPVPYVKPHPQNEERLDGGPTTPIGNNTSSTTGNNNTVATTGNNSTFDVSSSPLPTLPNNTVDHLSNNHHSNTSPRRPFPEPNQDPFARVKQARVPNAYDDTALKLEVGDIIKVTKINISGQWEGQIVLQGGKTGRKGHFPFTHVELVKYDPVTHTVTSDDNSIQNTD
ncbi:adapter molecule Crk [Folsomia candida]|uniref:Adapter molecule Crk n=1 Tax=Folsomia candida TaxID=158441 RepID=A0A226DGP1_FOLCA|nr:adapter molecule Crk [Folsomia candida]XP_021962676.1 adapter molecule Crk [Folsomia candida]OXA44014.1 Adapter molecule Crk [Folsomia candida]